MRSKEILNYLSKQMDRFGCLQDQHLLLDADEKSCVTTCVLQGLVTLTRLPAFFEHPGANELLAFKKYHLHIHIYTPVRAHDVHQF